MTLETYLAALPTRCPHGFAPVQLDLCTTCRPSEWDIFVAALRKAVRDDGTVHACDVRPLVRGRIAPKHISSSWRKAKASGLIVEVGHERSDDEAGRNVGRMEPYYSWVGVAA